MSTEALPKRSNREHEVAVINYQRAVPSWDPRLRPAGKVNAGGFSGGLLAKHEGKVLLGLLVVFLAVNVATGARCQTVTGDQTMWTYPAANTTGLGRNTLIATVVTGAPAITSINGVRTMFFNGRSGGGVDYDPLRLSVKVDCGAYGDGSHDDTAAIQACLNKFTAGRSAIASGSLFFPIGKYKITAPLYYFGSAGFPITISGVTGGWNNTNPESVIVWGGTSGGTMLEMMGAGAYTIETLTLDQAVTARIGIHIASDNAWNTTLGTAVSPGSNTVTPASIDSVAVGTLLSIDTGASLELVYVTATTPTTFAATFTKSHLATAQVGGSAGSSGGLLRNVYVVGVPDSATDWGTNAGAATAGIVVGNVTSRSTAQVSEVKMYDVFVYDNDTNGTCSGGIVFPEAGNAKNYWLYTPIVNRCQYGIDAFGGPNVLNVQGGDIASSTVADFRLAAAQTEISGVEVESGTGHRFVMNGSVGANPGNLTLIGNSFQSSAPADDYVVQWYGSLTMIENQWYNYRTGSSVAKVQVGGTGVTGAPGTEISLGNFFQNAPAGYAPFYDGSGNQLLPTYYASQPVRVMSFGDSGGTAGAMVALRSYSSASIITDANCGSLGTPLPVAGSGLIRTCNGGRPISFRSQSGGSDIPGMTTNSSDQLVLGGTAGISSAQVQGGVYATTANCSSSANPAVCGAASAGSVAIAASATSVVVNTTAVTANSQITVTEDSSLGTKLGVTCNTQSLLVLGVPKVTARTPGTSFTVGIEVGPTTSPLCVSYSIVN